MNNKLWKWMKSHKIATALSCLCICVLQALIIHALHKWDIGIPWLVAEWNPGDVLAYVSGFEAFLGTVFLGVVSLKQTRKAEETNKRLSEENNYLQKILSQKLLPIVKLGSFETTYTIKNDKIPQSFPSANKFTKFISYNTGSPEKPVNIICVNIDVKEGTPAYLKTLTFSVHNVSESIMRHICIDDITICGYKDMFSEIRCSNENPKNGISLLLTSDDSFIVQTMFYFNSEEIKSCWDSELGGLAVSMFFTNTTIAGIKFREFIDIRVCDNGYSRVSYGEGSFDEGSENNA